MAARGPQNGRRGLERGLPLGFWALPSKFFDATTPSMTFIVATNIVASQPPERRPTGMPHARANYMSRLLQTIISSVFYFLTLAKSLRKSPHYRRQL